MISDRFDRRGTVLLVLVSMAAMTAVAGELIRSGADWMPPSALLFYMTLSSVCSVLDTTNRPALVYDLLAVERSKGLVGTAMAFRSIGSSSGKIFGNQAVGRLVELMGVGPSFSAVAALLAGAAGLIAVVPSPPKAGAGGSAPPAKKLVLDEMRAGLELAAADPGFLSVIGVTVLASFFYWSHTPLLQVLATGLGASAGEAGLLASASGWGGLLIGGRYDEQAPSHRAALLRRDCGRRRGAAVCGRQQLLGGVCRVSWIRFPRGAVWRGPIRDGHVDGAGRNSWSCARGSHDGDRGRPVWYGVPWGACRATRRCVSTSSLCSRWLCVSGYLACCPAQRALGCAA